MKEDDEEEEDSKIVQNEISEDDDIETENEVVEEIAETDTSIVLIDTVSSRAEVKDTLSLSNQVKDAWHTVTESLSLTIMEVVLAKRKLSEIQDCAWFLGSGQWSVEENLDACFKARNVSFNHLLLWMKVCWRKVSVIHHNSYSFLAREQEKFQMILRSQ